MHLGTVNEVQMHLGTVNEVYMHFNLVSLFTLLALRKDKTLWSFGLSECNRVKSSLYSNLARY